LQVPDNRLRELPGIGETIAEIITNLQRTGTHPLLDKLRKDVPEGVLDMLSIPGLKPDKINIIHRELGITDLAALETAAREGRLKNVKGLGAAVQRKILQGLEIREHGLGARHLHRADELAASATETLQRSIPHLVRTVTAGDIRRGGELVSDLALVAEVKRLAGPPKVIKSGEISGISPTRGASGSPCFSLPGPGGMWRPWSSAPRQWEWRSPRRGFAAAVRLWPRGARPRSMKRLACNP